MQDPIPAFPPLSALIRPLAQRLNLPTLPLHIHEILLASVGYHTIYMLSAPLSALLFPKSYSSFSRRTKINWNVHVVSLIQSTFISLLAVYTMVADKERKDEEHRVHGYTGLEASVQAYALGYFIWDLFMSARYFDVFGIGFLMHALSACVVYILGFRPFVNYYAPVFVCFEFSSPFLNFHWFFDKLHMTGSKPQLYNGLTLLFVFFLCRIVYGPVMSYYVLKDVFQAYWDPVNAAAIKDFKYFGSSYEGPSRLIGTGIKINGEKAIEEVVQNLQLIPWWLVAAYLGSNVVLNFLNFYWFRKMIDAVRKRFTQDPIADKEKEEAVGEVAEKVRVEGTEIKVPEFDVGGVGGGKKVKIVKMVDGKKI